jgi:hypothetical protein
MALRAGLAIALVVACARMGPSHMQGRLPDNPCDVLTPAQMSITSGLEVTSSSRAETIAELVQARRGGRASSAGTICRYDTSSPFGSIAIEVPADRRAETFASSRAEAFATAMRRYRDRHEFPRSTAAIAGVGTDAWLVGGASLHVLVRDAGYFTVTTQNARPESRDLLTRIARRIVAELASPAPAHD